MEPPKPLMLTRRGLLVSSFCGLVAVAARPASTQQAPRQIWDGRIRQREYAVFWQKEEIGRHVYVITPTDGTASFKVTTDVDMTVKIGFITAFRYKHHSEEVWRDGYLESLTSETNDDGKNQKTTGRRTESGFETAGPAGTFTAPFETLTTNDLWTTELLAQRKIVDAQDGEFMGVSAQPQGDQQVVVSGTPRAVRVFEITTPRIAGTLWYEGEQWLGGRITRNGETVEYHPIG